MSGAPLLSSSGLEMLFLVLLALLAATVTADVTIDLSRAEVDQETGHFCVMQKVRQQTCISQLQLIMS